ncbi:hypothetical protein KY289_028673 [Solanum tuberosum]|nr:hypothetical protein KY289_028673 [Solanum tuberosum]
MQQPILNRLTESVFSTLNMYVPVIQYKASIIQLCRDRDRERAQARGNHKSKTPKNDGLTTRKGCKGTSREGEKESSTGGRWMEHRQIGKS